MSLTPITVRASLLAILADDSLDTGSLTGDRHGASWDDLVRLAIRHGVGPVLYEKLRAATLDDVPEHLVGQLRSHYCATALYNAGVLSQFAEATTALWDDGVAVIALKGVHLAVTSYGNVARRPMRDIDLLVPKDQLNRTRATLARIGFRTWMSAGVEQYCATHHHLPPFSRADAVPLEIHWTLTSPTAAIVVDTGGLWERAVPFGGGASSKALSPEDLLLHLCIHAAANHRFALPIRSLCDIRYATAHFGVSLQWDQFVKRAIDWGARSQVFWTLALAKKDLRALIPDEVLTALRPRNYRNGDLDILRRITFDPDQRLPSGFERVQSAPGFAARVREVARVTAPCVHVRPHRRRTSTVVQYLGRWASLLWRRSFLLLELVLRRGGVSAKIQNARVIAKLLDDRRS